MVLINPQSLDGLNEQIVRKSKDRDIEHAELVKLLPPQDRLLVEMALKNRLSRREMAQMLGTNAGTITRKLRHLLNCLQDPVVRALADPDCPLSATDRQIGVEHFLYREPISRLVRRHNLSRKQVCAALDYIRGWHRGRSSR